MTDKIEVYWGDPLDGERHSVDFQPDDKIKAQAFATWLESTDGVIPDSVKVKLPQQRGVACWPPVDPDYVPPIVGGILREQPAVAPPDGRYELADFEPTNGHLHTCQAYYDCDCAGQLYALTEDARG